MFTAGASVYIIRPREAPCVVREIITQVIITDHIEEQKLIIGNLFIRSVCLLYCRWYTESFANTTQAKRSDALQNIIYYYSAIVSGVRSSFI
jgi:hypothetical protein